MVEGFFQAAGINNLLDKCRRGLGIVGGTSLVALLGVGAFYHGCVRGDVTEFEIDGMQVRYEEGALNLDPQSTYYPETWNRHIMTVQDGDTVHKLYDRDGVYDLEGITNPSILDRGKVEEVSIRDADGEWHRYWRDECDYLGNAADEPNYWPDTEHTKEVFEREDALYNSLRLHIWRTQQDGYRAQESTLEESVPGPVE